MHTSFEDFLKAKNQADKPVDWEKRKKSWVSSIDKLYVNITKWLRPFSEKSLLNVKSRVINNFEENIGSYNISQLDIKIGNDTISIKPIGTIILGSYGRIDLNGPKGEVMLIEREWNEWEIVDRRDRLKRWPLTEESFKDILQAVANG